jgi:hypothetical protein
MSNVPVNISGTPPPSHLLNLPPEERSRGISNDTRDYVTPQFVLGQPMSQFCNKHNANYLPGAESGDTAIREIGRLYKGAEGVQAQHCGQRHRIAEFLPDRQGFVREHIEPPPGVIKRRSETGSKQELLFTSDGNVLVPTRQVFLLLEARQPAVLYASSSLHFFCRRWMTAIAQYRYDNGDPCPSYARSWQLRTVWKENAWGGWFTLAFQDLGWADETAFKAAEAFNRLVEGGNLRLSQPSTDI